MALPRCYCSSSGTKHLQVGQSQLTLENNIMSHDTLARRLTCCSQVPLCESSVSRQVSFYLSILF